MVVTRGEAGWGKDKGAKGAQYMSEGDLASGGGYMIQCTNVVLGGFTPVI